MTDLVKRASQALHGVPDGPWCVYSEPEVGLEPSIFSGVPGKIGFEPIDHYDFAFMRFAVDARTLVPAMADRIEVLEAKLAKAVEELDIAAKYHERESTWRDAERARNIRATLVELTALEERRYD
jgi:hypothetical protein